MFVTNHVLAGALIGRALGRHPAGAFVAGVVSHLAMDMCPHWGDRALGAEDPEFLRVARCDGCCGLAAMAVAAGLSPRRRRRSVVAAMAGAAVVDLDKPFDHFFGWNPFPSRWNRFHKAIQNESPDRMPVELAAATFLGLAVLAFVPERRGRRLTGTRRRPIAEAAAGPTGTRLRRGWGPRPT